VDRAELFSRALAGCRDLLAKYPGHPPLLSAIAQLEYLSALQSGEHSDRSRLPDIDIGLLTVRELEVLDPKLAEALYEVSGEARVMSGESVLDP
jgi:hypothetical protein